MTTKICLCEWLGFDKLKNLSKGSGWDVKMVMLGIDRDMHPLYILCYFKKMLQNFTEHVWPLIVLYIFLLSNWLILRQEISTNLPLKSVLCN